VIAIILAFGRALQHWKALVRVACVVAMASGSVSHVVADFSSANAAPIVIVQSDAKGACDSSIVVEQCHACCVVPFLTVAAVSRDTTAAGAVPDGHLPHLFAFRQPLTAPPPRLLT
jgi:hypothetical protein